MTPVDVSLVRDALAAALREDLGAGDVTSRATIPRSAQASGQFTAKQPIVVAGVPAAEEVVRLVDSKVHFRAAAEDGATIPPGAVLASVQGSACSILAAERTALNLLQRMCGIATLTRQFVDRVRGTRARILDTRKTAPGLRILDKYAVACGGGMNHRMGLGDGVLIKNNHLVFHPSVAHAVQEARRSLGPLVKIEVEVRNLEELRLAVEAGADVVLLDNFTPEQTPEAVALAAGRVVLESSGGVTLETVRAFAEAGVDYISIGALTHSAPAADIHLRVLGAVP
jgi:nicotinate-nucleotide pyrophosphorylase (carboxylating)